LCEVRDVHTACRDAGQDRNAQIGKPAREMPQDADLIRATRAAARQHEGELTVVRRSVRKLSKLTGRFDWHVCAS
jgi:hypothetical protein